MFGAPDYQSPGLLGRYRVFLSPVRGSLEMSQDGKFQTVYDNKGEMALRMTDGRKWVLPLDRNLSDNGFPLPENVKVVRECGLGRRDLIAIARYGCVDPFLAKRGGVEGRLGYVTFGRGDGTDRKHDPDIIVNRSNCNAEMSRTHGGLINQGQLLIASNVSELHGLAGRTHDGTAFHLRPTGVTGQMEEIVLFPDGFSEQEGNAEIDFGTIMLTGKHLNRLIVTLADLRDPETYRSIGKA